MFLDQEEYKEFNFNDSGCLLADKDLFETGLEEEDEDLGSLESIKAVVKEKMKKQKVSCIQGNGPPP